MRSPIGPSTCGALLSLRLDPQPLHVLEARAFRGLAALGEAALDMGEAAFELQVGRAQRSLRIDPEMAGEVRDREQEVAHLALERLGRAPGDLGLDLGGLLADFRENRPRVVPVEPDLARFLLQLERARKRRQGERNAVERAGPCLAGGELRALLIGLDASPERLHLGGVERARIAKDMGMTADELGGYRLDHSLEIEQARLFRHAGVKDDLQQEVAEFLAQILRSAALDRVGHFVGLFDRERGDRGEGLLLIPGAATNGIAQRRHDLDQAADVAGRLRRVQSESEMASRPFGVSTTLIVTCWPSAKCEMPAGPRIEIWTNTSLPPSSLATKPNPLASSNHFTFPVTETAVEGSGATRRGRGASPNARCGRSTMPLASTSSTRVTCAPLAPAPTWTRNFAPAGTASWPAA